LQTLLKELDRSVILKSKVVRVKVSKGEFRVIDLMLNNEIKNVIQDISNDVLFYISHETGREETRNKSIKFLGYSAKDFNVGEVVSIHNIKFFKDDKSGWMSGDITSESPDGEFASVESFCQYAGSTFTVPHFKEKTIQKFIETYAKGNKLTPFAAFEKINHIVEAEGKENEFINIVINYAPKRFSDNEIAKDIYKDWQDALTSKLGKIAMSLSTMGIKPNQANNISDFFSKRDGSDVTAEYIISSIKKNPYILMEMEGIGFKTADEIGLRIGIPLDDSNRIEKGIVAYFYKESNKDGHVLFNAADIAKDIAIELFLKDEEEKEEIISKYKSKLDEKGNNLFLRQYAPKLDEKKKKEILYKVISPAIREKFISIMVEMFKEKDKLILLHDKKDEKNYAISSKDFNTELLICKKVKSLNERAPLDISSYLPSIKGILDAPQNGFNLDNSQKEAVLSILNYNISCLTGGAGYGKTTVLKKLIECLKVMNERFILCAPTGKASMRMRESTGEICTTIHKALKISPINPDGEEVISDWLIIDESSMVDLFLAQKIFSNINPGCRIVFVGDPNQLPPVGRGSMFFDLIESGQVNVCRLNFLHRTGDNNDLNDISKEILEENNVNFYNRNNLTFVSYKQKEDSSHNGAIFKDVLDKYLALEKTYGIENVCILTPSRKEDRVLGCWKFNKAIREILKPDAEGDYEVDDRIMGIRNNPYFVNGQVGTITKLGHYECNTEKREADGTTRIEKEKRLMIEVLFDGDEVPTDCSAMGLTKFKDMIDYAYASTVHKAQGSEYKYVIIPLSIADSFMLNKNWLYTAVTRAKQQVYLYGMNGAINASLEKKKESRNTSLQGLLNDYYENVY
jgi:exonuclease V subunit alpha